MRGLRLTKGIRDKRAREKDRSAGQDSGQSQAEPRLNKSINRSNNRTTKLVGWWRRAVESFPEPSETVEEAGPRGAGERGLGVNRAGDQGEIKEKLLPVVCKRRENSFPIIDGDLWALGTPRGIGSLVKC